MGRAAGLNARCGHDGESGVRARERDLRLHPERGALRRREELVVAPAPPPTTEENSPLTAGVLLHLVQSWESLRAAWEGP